MMAAPPDTDSTIIIRCSNCPAEVPVNKAYSGPHGEPLCKDCWELIFRQWQKENKDKPQDWSDMV